MAVRIGYPPPFNMRWKNRVKRQREQLGMAVSTARARLINKILFSLVVKAGRNTCFECGELIESELDISIEHKQPWENRDTALFWDLENIAFSHRRCNKVRETSKLSFQNHGISRYMAGCRCDSCCDAKSRALKREARRKHPKEPANLGVHKPCAKH